MKKLIVLLLCLSLLFSCALAEISYPIEDGPTLKVWIDMDAGNSQMFTNYADNPVWQELMKVTGVKLEFVHPTYGAAKEGFSLMIANEEEWPDIIIDFDSYYNGGTVAGLEDGVIYDLTPYIEENAPEYYALVNSSPDVRAQFYNEEDQLLAFYVFNLEPNPTARSPILRTDLLEKFGLDYHDIDTYDEIEVYFQKVLDECPGMIPFLPCYDNNEALQIGMLGYDLRDDFMVIDGKITYYAVMDNYKAFLTRMHEWFEKGYIGIDYASTKLAQARKRYAAGELACELVPVGNAYSDTVPTEFSIERGPYWMEEEGKTIHVWAAELDKNAGYEAVVTTHCDESLLPVVCQFLNYGYTEDGIIFANYGPLGISTYVKDDGTIWYTDWVINNPDNETSVMHNVSRLHYWPRAALSDATCNPNVRRDEIVLELRTRFTVNPNYNHDYLLSTAVTLTSEETADRADIMVDVESYVKEMMYKFIQGDADIEAEWDNYLKTLERYKLNEAIEITQGAYDRYAARLGK